MEDHLTMGWGESLGGHGEILSQVLIWSFHHDYPNEKVSFISEIKWFPCLLIDDGVIMLEAKE